MARATNKATPIQLRPNKIAAAMRLSAHDASFLYSETASGPMHGVGFTLLGGPATYEAVFEFYAKRIHLIPRLRQKVAFVPFNVAHPKWVDDPDFDLSNHLKPHRVPPNTSIERAMEHALALGEPLLDRSRPLWLTYVIEGIEGGKTLLAALNHHAFIDGATAIAMTYVLTDQAPDAAPPPPPAEAWTPQAEDSPTALWQEAVAENAQKAALDLADAPVRAVKFAELAPRATSLMNRLAQPVMQAPWNAGLVGPKRQTQLLRYRLDEFKPIRAQLGGTINDLIIAVVAEGAARYLGELGEDTKDQSLRLMCPVNVRDAGADPLAMEGNRVSAMFPVLPAWPMPMLERLNLVRSQLEEIKSLKEPEVMDQLAELQPHIAPLGMLSTQMVGTPWDPSALAARSPLPVAPRPSGTRPSQTGFNFTCTNVPGPPAQQWVAGHPVEALTGTLMLGGNLGCGVGVGSYNGVFTLCFVADPRLLPQLDRFSARVAEAFAELVDLAQNASRD